MGSVYRAEQAAGQAPGRPQADQSRDGLRPVLDRFDAERQALALMDHPNIARVYDGGTTEPGQPFFVMELVSGVPITEYCDQTRLTVRRAWSCSCRCARPCSTRTRRGSSTAT